MRRMMSIVSLLSRRRAGNGEKTLVSDSKHSRIACGYCLGKTVGETQAIPRLGSDLGRLAHQFELLRLTEERSDDAVACQDVQL